MDCNNFADNCKAKSCSENKQITIADIHKFFDISKSSECSTSIIYLNRYSEGITLSKLYVKNIDLECNIFYTIKNNYYYIYPKFMENIILWSKHPKAFGNKGFLGNHISIGENLSNPGIYIHETVYDYVQNKSKHFLIANKKHTEYQINQKTLISTNAVLENKAQILWDDIYCYESQGIQSAGRIKILKTKSKDKSYDKFNESEVLEIIKERCKNLDKNKVYCINIPYVRPSKLVSLAKKIEKTSNMSIISNSQTKTTILLID
jgi:hypothetical protein